MHNAYTQVHHSPAYYVHNPRRDHHLDVYMHMIVHMCHSSRRDHMCIRAHMYSRDRSRRT